MNRPKNTILDKWLQIQTNLKALKQTNIWIGQFPYLVKEWRLWVQITQNFREIEGSWSGVIRRYLRMFGNRP